MQSQLSKTTVFFLKNARRFSLAYLALLIALGGLASISLKGLKTEYSVKQFLPPSHPLIEADNARRTKFDLPELEPFFALVQVEEGSWLEKARMEKLAAATAAVSSLEGVQSAISLATVEGASSTKEGLTVGRLVELTPSENWKERVLEDPLLAPQLISKDGRTAMVAVSLMEVSQLRGGQILEETRKKLEKEFPNEQVSIGGIPAVQSQIGATLGEELKNFLLLSMVGSLLMLSLFFRSPSSILVPMVLIVLAIVISLSSMVWMGITFSVLTSTLPVLVAVTVVSMSSHTMMRYAADWELAKRVHDNPNPYRVLFHSYQGLLLPNLLTSLTTAIGFFAIGFAKVPLVREYGLSVGFSIFICWAVVMSTLFPLLILLPVPKVRAWTKRKARWATLVSSYPRSIAICFTLMCGMGFYMGKDLNWSARLFDDLPADQEARRTTEFVDANLGGMIPLDILVSSEEENAWNDPVALKTLDDLAGKWRQMAAVGSVVGPQDLMRAAGKAQGRDLPLTRQEAAEYGFLYSFASENPYKSFVTSDGRQARVVLRLRDIPAKEMEKVVAGITADAKAALPNWKVEASAMATTVHFMNNELSRELIFGFWQALGLIALLLMVIYRSIRWTLLAVIPNLAPVAFLMGALYLSGTPIKPGIALIFSIAIGVSFDNTVYLLGRLRLLMAREGSTRPPITKAWFQEGNLCLYSSLSISAGFLVFLASYFAMNQQFGLFMLLAILGGLLSDLVFLPALLAALPWMIENKKKEKNMSRRSLAMGTAAMVLVFGLGQIAFAAKAGGDPREILKKVEKNVGSKDEVASIKMVIMEKDGSSKNRSLKIMRKGEDSKQKVLVRLQGPADLKGTALLSVNKDQWLYLPSQKQARRIQSGNKKSSFMDSELSYEDLSSGADVSFESKYMKEESQGGRKYAVIENTPKGESAYGKILLWVDVEKYLIGKMEYFDKAMKPLKVSTFSGYKQFDQGVWRAQKIDVKNLQTKRGTVLELSDLKVNKGIDDSEFTESALSDSD